MYGQYSRAVSNQERVIVARVRQVALSPTSLSARCQSRKLIQFSKQKQGLGKILLQGRLVCLLYIPYCGQEVDFCSKSSSILETLVFKSDVQFQIIWKQSDPLSSQSRPLCCVSSVGQVRHRTNHATRHWVASHFSRGDQHMGQS